jgi:hypothetical protein
MLRRVHLVRTDVSDELSASYIWATRIGELATTLAVDWQPIHAAMILEVPGSSETWVLKRATQRNILEDGILRRVN